MAKSLIARTYLEYMRRTPEHRGKQRLARIISWVSGPSVVRTIEDVRMRIWLHDAMSRSYVGPGALGSVLRSELRNLSPGQSVLNIGAHAGLAAILAAKQVAPSGIVWAVEPNVSQYFELVENIRLNGCKGLVTLNMAVADYCGLSELWVDPFHTGTTRLLGPGEREQGELESGLTFSVPVVDGSVLDAILGDITIDLVILDVEGAEGRVVAGIRPILERTTRVVVEVTDSFLTRFGDSREGLYQAFDQLGFHPLIRSSEWQYDEVFIRH